MNIISKLFKKEKEETEATSKGSVEEFVTLIRVYYQAVMAVQLGITNINMLSDMALFKRMLKIPTQNNKPGIAEKARVRKILMQDYAMKESFFKEIEASVKKNCKSQNDIKSYFFLFQGFCNDLFSLLDNLMQTMNSLHLAYENFENATDPELIDSYIYEVNAIQMRYQFLLCRLKSYEIAEP